MKLSGTLRKETSMVAIGSLICSVIMQLIFYWIGQWDKTVLYANLCTWLLTTLNFFAMGITVNCTIKMDDAKCAGRIVRVTQICRLFLCCIILAVIILFFRTYFHVWALLIPLLFPQIILILHGILQKEEKDPFDSDTEN